MRALALTLALAAASCTAPPATRAAKARIVPSEQAGLYYLIDECATEPASLAALVDDQGQLVDLVTGAVETGAFIE